MMKASIAEQPSLPVESTALDLRPVATEFVSMLERLAANKDVDVDKLQKLIDMQERILRHNAKAEFDAAFAQMQGEIPIITERGEIVVNGQVRSRYAKFEDILEVVRPILQKHGFALRHRNTTAEGKLKIVGILSHRSGHSEEDEFEAEPDASGAKGDIQQLGSTRSYGQRYTTLALLNIATRGADDDGARSGRPTPPTGYQDWCDDLTATADNGIQALEKAWAGSKAEYKTFTVKHDKAAWDALKKRAAAVRA